MDRNTNKLVTSKVFFLQLEEGERWNWGEEDIYDEVLNIGGQINHFT